MTFKRLRSRFILTLVYNQRRKRPFHTTAIEWQWNGNAMAMPFHHYFETKKINVLLQHYFRRYCIQTFWYRIFMLKMFYVSAKTAFHKNTSPHTIIYHYIMSYPINYIDIKNPFFLYLCPPNTCHISADMVSIS